MDKLRGRKLKHWRVLYLSLWGAAIHSQMAIIGPTIEDMRYYITLNTQTNFISKQSQWRTATW